MGRHIVDFEKDEGRKRFVFRPSSFVLHPTPAGAAAGIVLIAALALAFGLLPLPLAALSLLAPLALVLLLSNPLISLYLAILSVPIQEVLLLPGGATLTQAAVLLAVFHAALSWLARPRPPRFGRLLPLWLAFLWALVLSAAFTPFSTAEALKETLRWAEAFAIWLLTVGLVRRPRQVAGLIACLLLAPAAEALVGLAQFALGIGPPSFRIAAGLPFVRAYGTIGQPNSFAGYLNMAWPLALALAIGLTRSLWSGYYSPLRRQVRQGSERTKDLADLGVLAVPIRSRHAALLLVLAAWVAAALLLGGLAASFSRGAWIGAACGMLGMALALGGRARWWALAGLALAGLALALGGAGLLPAAAAARMASITRYVSLFDAGSVPITPDNFAVVERMSQMQAGWRMFLTHPLTGVGPGNFSTAYPRYAVGSWYVSRGHAHNYYLHLAAETGAIGLLAYLALLAGIVRQLRSALKGYNNIIKHSIAIGCCGIIAAVAGHDLFENLHVLSMGIQLAAVWGLLATIGELEKRPQNQSTR